VNQKWFGWKGKILRINLTTGKVVKQVLPKDLAKNYIGCRGINAKILYDEVRPKTNAFAPDNILIFGTGPLEGTPVGMGRISVATKSPRGCIAEGGFGGFFAPELKFAGYDFLIVHGKAKKPVYIWIDDEIVEIRDATHIWGRDTWETDKMIKEDIGDYEIEVCYIGPAAENLVAACPIINGLTNSGGRTDCGTVMGAKKLKAVAVRGSGEVEVARPKEFDEYHSIYYLWKPISNENIQRTLKSSYVVLGEDFEVEVELVEPVSSSPETEGFLKDFAHHSRRLKERVSRR